MRAVAEIAASEIVSDLTIRFEAVSRVSFRFEDNQIKCQQLQDCVCFINAESYRPRNMSLILQRRDA